METAGGRDGGDGWMRGEGGMEGRGQRRGQRHTPSLPPRVLDSDEGVGWHICASYFLPPPVPATSSTGAGVNPTRRPRLTLFTPLVGGVLFLRR
jgi:hypothetical protein